MVVDAGYLSVLECDLVVLFFRNVSLYTCLFFLRFRVTLLTSAALKKFVNFQIFPVFS